MAPRAPVAIVSPQPLPRQIAAHIRDLIIHDVLKPGERVRERQIAEELGVSRTPLRDALKILAMERLIDVTPNRGATVVDPAVDEIAEMLAVYTELEALGGRLACGHAGEADIAEVTGQHDLLRAAFAREDRIAYFRANQAFHLAIVAGSHNRTLIEMHGHLNMRLYRIRYLAILRMQDWRSAASAHAEILAALVQRDGAGLATLLAEHLGFARRLVEALSHSRDDRACWEAAPTRRHRAS